MCTAFLTSAIGTEELFRPHHKIANYRLPPAPTLALAPRSCKDIGGRDVVLYLLSREVSLFDLVFVVNKRFPADFCRQDGPALLVSQAIVLPNIVYLKLTDRAGDILGTDMDMDTARSTTRRSWPWRVSPLVDALYNTVGNKHVYHSIMVCCSEGRGYRLSPVVLIRRNLLNSQYSHDKIASAP